MSTNTLPPFYYTPIHNALASHIGHSVVVYTSTDRVIFDAHPSPIYGHHSISDLSYVLPELNTKFAIQVSNLYTRQAIDLAPYPQSEVDLNTGLIVRVVDDTRDLLQLPNYEAVFVRSDGSLVIWGDDEDAVLSFWIDIVCRLQSRSESAIPTTTPVGGLPAGNDGINTVDTSLWDNALPRLDEFADLLNLTDNWPPWADPQGYYEASPYSSWQRMVSAEPSGSLGFVLPRRARSPFSDITTTSSSLVNSPSTADMEGIFPSYAPSVYVGEEDNISLDLSLSIGDRGVSPILSSSQCTVPGSTPPVPEQASGSSSYRRHSVVETSAPRSFAHGIDQKATREDEEDFLQPIINLNGSASDTATGNADVDLRSTSNTRVLKRSHSVIATGSAPARLTTPLPDVEYVQPEDDKRRKFLAIAPAPPPASASTSSPAPATFPSPSSSISTPASGKPQRRPGNSRRGGGGTTRSTGKNARGKRHPCDYCGKTFTRLQDRNRHCTTSCDASPMKSTVDCPECGSILSRLDAAQRHWRQHENPTCPTPDWASCRS